MNKQEIDLVLSLAEKTFIAMLTATVDKTEAVTEEDLDMFFQNVADHAFNSAIKFVERREVYIEHIL